MTRVYAGIDLGGTNFRLGLRPAGPGDARLIALESRPADGGWSPDDVVELVEETLVRVTRRSREPLQLAGLGMGLTGDIDCLSGVCHSMKRFPGLEGAPIRDLLQGQLGVPVHLLNDGLTAALGELRAGAGQGVDDFVMVTLGTGIGGGVVLGGRLLTGARGRIGKVGHQILDVDGEVDCHCGLRGCWQGLAGKAPVEKRARRVALAHPGSALAREVAAGGEVDLRRVAVLAAEGDAAALAVMEETGRYVGIGLANLVKILAPERVILGGGIAEGNPALFAAVQRTLDQYAIKPYQRVPVVPAALGWEAGVLGATFLAEEGLPG